MIIADPRPKSAVPKYLWNEIDAGSLSKLELLAYRSRLLTADRSVVNVFGGNTSSKVTDKDHAGREVRVLWVKGSGSDMADCTQASFAGLRLDEVLPLIDRDEMSDEEMVTYLNCCAFQPGRPRQSIETLLHAFLAHPEVDHTHPDSIISLACTKRGRKAAEEVFGERMVWADYIRPGFALSKEIALALLDNPMAQCVVMGKHGLITWGETAKECYERTIAIIQEGEDAIRAAGRKIWTGAETADDTTDYEFLPIIRGAVSEDRKQVILLDRSSRVMQMINTDSAEQLSQIGAACPDHLVHVKRNPLYIKDISDVVASVKSYRNAYEQYFKSYARQGDEMFDSAPRVILIPGFGMVAVGRDAKQASVSRDLYHRAIEVIEGAEIMGGFESLTAEEAFGIEYWPLELYKLKQRPPERELAGYIAVITGGGGGIGRATAKQMAEQGAHVAVLDINFEKAQETANELRNAIAIRCDATSEFDIESAFKAIVKTWGGLDILVCSAGIASSAPIEDTSLDDWERIFAVLARGYFLPSREAFRIWKRQGIGGSLVFVTSKSAIASGKNASAYSSAKAAEQHLARCLADEGGAIGVRVNCVLPDAVLQGSSIWDGEWRRDRAEAYGIAPEDLEEFYRNRSILKVSVFPDDVAEAILYLAGPRSSKTTGAAITVDGGVSQAYVR